MKTIAMFLVAVALMLATTVSAKDLQYDMYSRSANGEMKFYKTIKEEVAKFNPPSVVPDREAINIMNKGEGNYSEPKSSKTVYKNFSVPLVGTTITQKNTYSYNKGVWLSVVTEEKKVGDKWSLTFFWVIFPLACIFLSGVISRVSEQKKDRSKHLEKYVLFCVAISIAILCGVNLNSLDGLAPAVVFSIITIMAVAITIRTSSSFSDAVLTFVPVIIVSAITIVMLAVAGLPKTEALRYLVLMTAVSSGGYLLGEIFGIIDDRKEKRKQEKQELGWQMTLTRAWQRETFAEQARREERERQQVAQGM